jgi:hypothetical protein
VAKELAALPRVGVVALREKYAAVFGEATATGNTASGTTRCRGRGRPRACSRANRPRVIRRTVTSRWTTAGASAASATQNRAVFRT